MNRLAAATSPYLLQHAGDPVDWHEWGEAAFAQARREDKPLLVSIGYAACHWCHVMGHESFADPQIAAAMNADFVSIKVDREERPDVDHLCMSALHVLGEPGGWPLTMFMTPDGAPFFGGTYFPRRPAFGRPGFGQVLGEIARLYREERGRVAQNRDAIARALAAAEAIEPGPALGPDELDEAARRLVDAFDPVDGGLGGAPKFPSPTLLEAVWRHASRSGDEAARRAFHHTLGRIARGGIHDHIGGGFARYSTDARWLVPHFEKMLGDNAQLLELFALAASESDDGALRDAAYGIVAWLEREMVTPEGAYATSLDADQEGVEGKFYVWSLEEVTATLSDEGAALFARLYDIRREGNWEGVSIPNRLDTPEPTPAEATRLDDLKARLLARRETRVRPARDDKILADWNGLAVAALARAGILLDEPGWIARARAVFEAIAETLRDGDGLGHATRAGRHVVPGFASDHAAMMRAALILHEATGDDSYLERARTWRDVIERDYRVPETGLLAMTHARAGNAGLPLRPQPLADDAVPNANGLYAEALVRLAQATGAAQDRDRAERFLATATGAIRAAPVAHGSILNAFDLALRGIAIVLSGEDEALAQAALRLPWPERTVTRAAALCADHPAYVAAGNADSGQAILCAGGRCALPAATPDEIAHRRAELQAGPVARAQAP